ncbi:hypothetical protein [Hyphococcus sp.]|uniref:hypothetical protein n=1 Tax=Hyphococcus sp. TaxID=2038636 RepID=UPI0020834F62|nr:MAG: hypothetical protein DHS20C04_08130 [Marinicaulis sp.]
MARLILALAGILLFSLQAARAEGPSGLLAQFEGHWMSEGPAFGGAAKSEMIWTPALNGKFFRLEYRVAVTRDDGAAFTFEGIAHYRLANDEPLTAYWADNSGDLHPIRAEREGDALVAHWGVEGAKQGRTRYELLPAGEIEVTDWIKTADGWRQFNQNQFAKQAPE